ncbi:MAG TPA: hypothetical protein VMT76_09045 [Puia sp.]|nr:hypothetical protein [Puia sp.]
MKKILLFTLLMFAAVGFTMAQSKSHHVRHKVHHKIHHHHVRHHPHHK